jgi:hypothetical protein
MYIVSEEKVTGDMFNYLLLFFFSGGKIHTGFHLKTSYVREKKAFTRKQKDISPNRKMDNEELTFFYV